jgi:hypothetical protein
MIQTIRRVMSVTKPLTWGNYPCGGEAGGQGTAARVARESPQRRQATQADVSHGRPATMRSSVSRDLAPQDTRRVSAIRASRQARPQPQSGGRPEGP